MCCFDSSCKIRRALNGLTAGCPSHTAPGDKIQRPKKAPHHRNKHSLCSFLNRRLQFPASPQNYSDRPAASPEGARDAPPTPCLLMPQSLPPTVPGCSLSLWVQCPHESTWHSGSPPPGSEYMWLINQGPSYLSNAKRHLFGHLHSQGGQ